MVREKKVLRKFKQKVLTALFGRKLKKKKKKSKSSLLAKSLKRLYLDGLRQARFVLLHMIYYSTHF